MPTYEYRCEQCGKRFARVESISAHASSRPSCPKCRSKKVERILTAFFAKTAKKS